MTSLLIRTISDLYRTASVSICFLTAPHQRKPGKKRKKKKGWPVFPITMVEFSSLSNPAMGVTARDSG